MKDSASVMSRLHSSNPWMDRHGAFIELRHLGPDLVQEHTEEILEYLRDDNPSVRALAIEALSVLEAGCLAQHASVFAALLSDMDIDVCIASLRALALLESQDLAPHSSAICKMMNDDEEVAQMAALQAMGRIDSISLEPHFDQIKALAKNGSKEVTRRSSQIYKRIERDLADLPKVVITLQQFQPCLGEFWSVTGSNIAGNQVDLSVNQATTCGELRARFAQQLHVMKFQVKLVLQDAQIIAEEAEKMPLRELILA